MINPLDLYAKIESLIGFDAQYEKLYQIYLSLLKPLHVKTVLDVGCGNGTFLKHLQNEQFDAYGIDRSVAMVERSLTLGMNASTKELEEFGEASFECVVAIADVLNYISPTEMDSFLEAVARVLPKEGYFIFDVNTLYGFEGVADGVMCQDKENQFLCVDATFSDKELLTKIVLFEKEDELYRKVEGSITQYFHPLSFFKKLKMFKLCSTKPVTLFGDEPDKTILILQKR
ncbi:class I SAM-dependent methyltransferase [Sulfurospirillum diekertiae]|uniref:Class I SAM-dependent methyltransferase n=1 Tax=Sulfurospirillum diekertiae TaxID=1854492 RepID=A0A6G9VUD8_9BACT|nr:class I SAM-dependent methyltransferase [Sulfurospirillum diekertiae]QIR76549.1 class I SAM-dependent methyltransferase [Sulfurospirillum diekertiae]QIR79176.1 class I SAM-dependent methyltransferase [Sulfurospirillum diekertiae]